MLGNVNIDYLEQYNPKEFVIQKNGTFIKAIVNKRSKDGTGKTPDKRRNEISFRNAFIYNYEFDIQIKGSQKNAIVNIWQIKKLGDNYPIISLGIKRQDQNEKLAYKKRDNSSIVIKDADTHHVVVDCKNGNLYVDKVLITTFKPYIGESSICKFGIEADDNNVDQEIVVTYSNIKLIKINGSNRP